MINLQGESEEREHPAGSKIWQTEAMSAFLAFLVQSKVRITDEFHLLVDTGWVCVCEIYFF